MYQFASQYNNTYHRSKSLIKTFQNRHDYYDFVIFIKRDISSFDSKIFFDFSFRSHGLVVSDLFFFFLFHQEKKNNKFMDWDWIHWFDDFLLLAVGARNRINVTCQQKACAFSSAPFPCKHDKRISIVENTKWKVFYNNNNNLKD